MTPTPATFLAADPRTHQESTNPKSARDTAGTDPVQAFVDQEVAAMVALSPTILTALSTGIAAVAGVSHQAVQQRASKLQVERPAETLAELPERLQTARKRRLAFRSALGALRGRGSADMTPIREAIAAADVDSIVAATIRHSLGAFLDSECDRPGTELHLISATLEAELVAAIYADPRTVLANLPADDGIDAAYVRSHALAAVTPSAAVFDAFGQPTLPRPPSLSMFQTLVPR